MPFEVYRKGSAPVSSVPTATIQKRGNISLNLAAYRLINSPEGVELLWDAENRVVGLRPAPLTGPNAYPVRAQGRNNKGPFLVAAAMFMKYIDNDVSVARRWVPRVQDEVLCIDLNAESQVATGPRERGEARASAASEDLNTRSTQMGRQPQALHDHDG